MHTQAVEDYLKAVYEIQREQGEVTTTALAERLDVSPASVTGMVKKLAGMKLLTHEPYQGVTLTRAGLKIALEVIRHHRLVELYLTEALGVPWDQVHSEAEKWEHVLSEELEDRMDALLGHPTTDPHGAPIPSRDGTLTQPARLRLADMQAGQSAAVAEVSDHNPALLRYLGDLGLYPKVHVTVMAVAPFHGPLTIRMGEVEHSIGHEAAQHVYVTRIANRKPGGAR